MTLLPKKKGYSIAFRQDYRKGYNQAIDDCKQSLIEGLESLRKQGIKHKEYPMQNGSHYSPKDNQKVGHNEAINIIIKSLEETL